MHMQAEGKALNKKESVPPADVHTQTENGVIPQKHPASRAIAVSHAEGPHTVLSAGQTSACGFQPFPRRSTLTLSASPCSF